jgi:hypothetical protein
MDNGKLFGIDDWPKTKSEYFKEKYGTEAVEREVIEIKPLILMEEQEKTRDGSARRAGLRWEERKKKYAEKTKTKKKAAKEGNVNYKLKKAIENDLPTYNDGLGRDEDYKKRQQ